MAKIDEDHAKLVKQYFQNPGNPLVNAVAIGYLPGDESPQILIFVDPSVADCDRTAIDGAAPSPHKLLRAGRFVGLQTQTGASVSPYDPFRYNLPPFAAGTLGAVVDAGGKQYVLSSNHVLAHNGRVPQATPVATLGPLDDANVGSVIATRSDFVELQAPGWPLKGAPPNLVDCALAEVTAPITSATPIDVFASPSPGTTPSQTIPITKNGRSTGMTQSQIRIFHWAGYIDFSFGIYYFEEMMGTYDGHNMFAAPGDSGSLAVDSQGLGVGLITARGYVFDPTPDQFASHIILTCALDSVRSELAKGLGVAHPKNIKFSK
jgi:hypothetical protein